jgi:hypothetical protein
MDSDVILEPGRVNARSGSSDPTLKTAPELERKAA